MERIGDITTRVVVLVLLYSLPCVSNSSDSDVPNLVNCSFRGTILKTHEVVWFDPCTECMCYNGTTTCNIESCPSELGCSTTEVVIIPKECCPLCPYVVIVRDTTINLYQGLSFTEDETATLEFRLDISVDRKRTSKFVRGDNLWKLSAWLSPNWDGSGRKYSYKRNVFNKDDAAKEYHRWWYPPWIWSNVTCSMTFRGGTCADYKYFCVRFERADDPTPEYDLQFNVEPVNDEEGVFIDCAPLGECTGRPSVLTINSNGTITIELPSYMANGTTSYRAEYRKMNTTLWISEDFFNNSPKLLTGNLEEGVAYELNISLYDGDEYRDTGIFETFTMPCRDIDVNFELRSLSHRYGLASIITNWNYGNRKGFCSVTNQMLSFNQIDLDDCADPTNPFNKTVILTDNERHYKHAKLRANTAYNVTLTVEDHYKRNVTSRIIRTVETIPTSPPGGISLSSNTKFGQLLIRWNPLPCGARNAPILSYSVELKTDQGIKVHNFKSNGAKYAGFKIGEPYSFRVAAINSHGIGPFSSEFAGTFGAT